MLFAFLLCLAFFFWADASRAATYYVNPSGSPACSNGNDGTSSGAPWCNPPGTRNTANSGYTTVSWGIITTSNKIQCNDVILLRGGATQTSTQGGSWKLDGDFYTATCAAGSSITLRVATSAEWAASSGNFTLDGSGMEATCFQFCGDTHGLVTITNINTFIFGGISATQRFVVRDALSSLNKAHGILISSTTTIQRFIGQWIESLFNDSDGVAVGDINQGLVRDTIAHDNGSSGFSTGLLVDHQTTAFAYQDVEAYNNGPPTVGSVGDQFNFIGCESCYLIRSKGRDGFLRGLNYGNISSFGGLDMFLLIRDSEFWENGRSADDNAVFAAGPCWSGDDATGGQLQRGIMQRTIVYRHPEGGAPCAYGQGWGEIWNSVLYANGTESGGDLSSGDNERLAVYNTIVQASGIGQPWAAPGPNGGGPWRCPISNYNLYRPVAADSETLASFTCIGGFIDNGSHTFASPPPFIGANDRVGVAFTTGFVATHTTIYENNDFHLTSGSSAIDAGTHMMRANGAGSGMSINVLGNGGSNDPRHYFLSPASYYQVSGDVIQIAGCGSVTITSMTASAISFTPSCASWVNGAGIHFPWNGSAPDMGVYEFVAAGPSARRIIITQREEVK